MAHMANIFTLGLSLRSLPDSITKTVVSRASKRREARIKLDEPPPATTKSKVPDAIWLLFTLRLVICREFLCTIVNLYKLHWSAYFSSSSYIFAHSTKHMRRTREPPIQALQPQGTSRDRVRRIPRYLFFVKGARHIRRLLSFHQVSTSVLSCRWPAWVIVVSVSPCQI